MKNLFLIILFFNYFFLEAQNKKNIDLLIQTNRFSLSEVHGLKPKEYVFLGKYYLDRYNKKDFDFEQLREGLSKLVPNKQDSVFLNIDIENQVYKDLRSDNQKTRKNAVEKFIKVVDFVKRERPSVKVGFYGIPFTFNFPFQKRYNYYDDLKPLLEKVDYISPNLYFSYSHHQKSDLWYVNKIQENLDLFLEYSYKIRKPLYIYVWYLVHPYNKQYGMQLISENRMNLLLKTIQETSYKGQKAKGIIWWQPASTDYNTMGQRKMDINELLIRYTKGLK